MQHTWLESPLFCPQANGVYQSCAVLNLLCPARHPSISILPIHVESDLLPVPGSFDPKDAEATLFVKERDPFNHTGQIVGGVLRSGTVAFIRTESF